MIRIAQTRDNRVHAAVPAKVNLVLRVLGRRSDGYHDLQSLMCAVGLYDQMRFVFFSGSNMTIRCNHPDVPTDERNLVWKAADRFYDAAGVRAGLQVEIDKQIPVGAGLGGGSGNAAAMLRVLNRYFGSPLAEEQLAAIALSVGADVPFFLGRSPAWAEGVGEKLAPACGLPSAGVVLVNPGVVVSTRLIFENLKLGLTTQAKINTNTLLKEGLFGVLSNDLEAVTERFFPVVGDVKTALRASGAVSVGMSGSGPTVMGLFGDRSSAETAANTLDRKPGWSVCVTELLIQKC
ncbi:MAG: 4-(cytidine 5'-diphospho)-2-C-methyl-D-erythritol kinase [Deltaproteobacteria bacterium]|nr:MAG: 4-(cytidine 5'-diphospho)-2-C-methyl-D-erythritol kinase [Deltaproteobacteria bacterium]